MPTDPPQADPPQRKRRWFQFSLRTMLIVVTLLAIPCAYVGWEAKIVRARQSWLKLYAGRYSLHGPYSLFVPGHPEQTPSKLRRWLGDQAQEFIIFESSASREEKESAALLFPEADFIDLPVIELPVIKVPK